MPVRPGLIPAETIDRIREEFGRLLDGIRTRDRAAGEN